MKKCLLIISLIVYQINYSQNRPKIKQIKETIYDVKSSFGQIKKVKSEFLKYTLTSYNKKDSIVYREYWSGDSSQSFSKTIKKYNNNTVIEDYYSRDYLYSYKYNAYGDISSVNSALLDETKNYKYEYNIDSLIVLEKVYDEYGINDSIVYRYNKDKLKISEIHYDADKDTTYIENNKYNKNNQIIKKVADGVYSSKYAFSYFYDKDGNQIKIVKKYLKEFDFLKDEVYVFTKVFNNGDVVSDKTFKNDTLISNYKYSKIVDTVNNTSTYVSTNLMSGFSNKHVNFFDKNKNLIKYEVFSEDGLKVGYGFNRFNSKNQLVKRIYFDLKRIVKTYNDANLLLEEKEYNANGANIGNSFYYYTKDNRFKKKVKYKKDKISEEVIRVYNNSDYTQTTTFPTSKRKNVIKKDFKVGLVIKQEFNGKRLKSQWKSLTNGSVEKISGFRGYKREGVYETNFNIIIVSDKGLSKKVLSKYDDEDTITNIYEYKYDNFGNWISQLVKKNGIPITLTEREIMYW